MNYRYDDQQQQLLNIVDRGTPEQLFTFLQEYHRQPFQSLTEVLRFATVIDDQIDFIDCTGTRYNVTPLIIAAGKGSFEKTKILLVHGANPNKQCGTGDTALNLAVHRQKYLIVNLLLQYRANPNLYNHAGKTALHRAVAAYTNENAQQIRLLLDSGANLYAEDRNQRIPLDEAVIANKPDIIDVLISYDRTLIQHSYRAAILASRLGHDTCLQRLLNYGLNPNISDQTNTTPLHVAVRSLKPSTARLLLANGADPKISNNRGETPLTIAEYLQPDQQQDFLNLLNQNSRALSSDSQLINPVASVYPLLQCRSNWTLNSDEYRSQTANDSSVENLLNTTTGTFWRSTQSKNAWVIFDFKHQYNITGIRIVGCENPSMPRNGYLEISNSLKGPWFKVTDFTCRFDQETKTDVFFSSTKTRFVRVNIQDNYGGNDIQIQAICFFGVDTRLINLLQEYRLENSLNTLLSNGINDQESLYDNQDEILNSSDKYLHVNDHFQFIHLIESLKKPQLTFLEWFVLPQTTAIAGEKFHTFSVTSDENLTDRVQLEEQLENSPQATVVLMKDLEPIQGHSLVDFSDYIIKQPGRYRIRVSSIESPHIHTTWHAIVVGSSLPYPSSLRTSTDERLYLSSTTQFLNDTSSDKDNTLNSRQRETIIFANKNNRSLIQRIYESDNDEFVSFQPIEQSPYYFPLIDMSHRTTSDNLNANGLINYRPNQPYKPEHYTQTKPIDYFDHSTNTDDELLDESFNQTRFKSIKPNKEIYLTPTKYRTNSRTPLSNIFSYNNNNDNNNSHRHEQQQRQENTNYNDDDNETLGYGEKIIIPTKYRLKQERKKQLMNGENLVRSPVHTLKQQNGFHRDHSPEEEENNYYVSTPPPPQQQQQRQSQHKSRSQTQDYERRQFQNSSPVPQQQKKQSIYNTTRNGLKRETPPLQEQSNYYRFDARFNSNQLIEPTQPPQEQPNQDDVDEPQNETQRKESIKSPSLQYQQHQTPQTQKDLSRDSSSERTPSQYYELDHAQQQNQPSSNHQQKQPWERINSDARVSPSVIKQEQQQLYTKRDEIEQDPIYYDEVVNTQSESDQESPVQYQKRPEQSPVQYQKRPEQSPYNHFQIIAGDFELRASPRDENVDLNESKPTQMQLIFKATLQGPDVEKRARHSIRELVTQRSRSQSNTSNRTNSIDTKKTSLAKNPQSLNPTDRQKVNSTDIISTYEQEDQTESNRNSRSNSMAYMGQSPLKRIQPDQVDLLVTPKRTSIPIPPSSLLRNDSVQQTNLDDQPSAKRRNTENDQTFDGIHEQTPPITVQNYIPLTYERNPFRRTDNPVTSPILSPSKAEQKAKYYFGKSVPSQQSDNEEENDNEVECETFGHSSQPRLLTSTSAKRNLDYPSTTNPQFEQQTDAKTSISDSLAQELRRRFVNQNQTSTEQANDSPKKSQTSPQSNNEASDSYLTPTNYNAISQIPSNAASTGFQRQYPSDSNIYEQASEIKPIQEESSPPRRFPENKTDERPTHSNEDENDDGEEEDDDDDNNHDNQHNDDSQTDDDAEEDQDVHDQKQNDHSYVNEVVREEEESQQPSNAYQSGISTLVQQDPVRDTTNDNAPPQYPVPLTTQQKPPKQKGGFFSFLRKKNKTKPPKQNSKNKRK